MFLWLLCFKNTADLHGCVSQQIKLQHLQHTVTGKKYRVKFAKRGWWKKGTTLWKWKRHVSYGYLATGTIIIFYHPYTGDSKPFHLSYGKDIFIFHSHLQKKWYLFVTVHLPLSRACLSCVELQTDLIACTQTLTQILCHKETHQSTSQPINKKDDI